MPTKTLSRTILVAALAVAAVTLSGCNFITQALSGEDDVFSLKVGDCMNDYGDETEITTVPIVECAEPHDTEIYASSNIAGDEYPGLSAVQEEANNACYDAFADFVGLSYEESILYYSTLYPTEESWAGGDREILCGISKYDEDTEEIIKVTGSLEGSAE